MTRFITIFRDPRLAEWDHHVSFCLRDAEETVANLIKRGVTLYSTAPLGDTMVELSDHTHQNGEDKTSADAVCPEGTNPALHLSSVFRTMLGADGHATLSQSAKAGIEFRQLVEQYYREGRLVYVSDENVVVSKDDIKTIREMSDRHYKQACELAEQVAALTKELETTNAPNEVMLAALRMVEKSLRSAEAVIGSMSGVDMRQSLIEITKTAADHGEQAA